MQGNIHKVVSISLVRVHIYILNLVLRFMDQSINQVVVYILIKLITKQQPVHTNFNTMEATFVGSIKTEITTKIQINH